VTASSVSAVDTDAGGAGATAGRWGGRREVIVPPSPADELPLGV